MRITVSEVWNGTPDAAIGLGNDAAGCRPR